MRHTVRGILIKDRQVLLVTGHGADFYWTPGGGVEPGESTVDALYREIKEELGVEVKEYIPYYSYKYENQEVDNFLITIDGEIEIGEEITGYVWYSSDSRIKPSDGFVNILQPKLINEKLLI